MCLGDSKVNYTPDEARKEFQYIHNLQVTDHPAPDGLILIKGKDTEDGSCRFYNPETGRITGWLFPEMDNGENEVQEYIDGFMRRHGATAPSTEQDVLASA